MSTAAVGTTSLSNLAPGAGLDSDSIVRYFTYEQARTVQNSLSSQSQVVAGLQQQLKNALNQNGSVAPLLSQAQALDQKITWSVDRGDDSALKASQTHTLHDAKTASTSALDAKAAATDADFPLASDADQLAADAASSAHDAAKTASPMASLAAAEIATQKASEALKLAQQAKSQSTQALSDATDAKAAADAELSDAKAALGAATTDEDKASAQARVDAAIKSVDAAETSLHSARALDKAADAALAAATDATTAAASASATAALLAEPKVISLDNGNQLLIGPEAGQWAIKGAQGKELDISSDLEVTSPDDPSINWKMGADSTFVLTDGTKISLDTEGGKANGLTITKGNQVITVSGMDDDTPTISNAQQGGRAIDAQHNDGHIFTQNNGVWNCDGSPISPGASVAMTEAQNEVPLETNDIALPQDLLNFLQANNLQYKDSDGDGKLNADELRDLSAKLKSLVQSLSNQSSAALQALQQGTSSLIDFSSRLQQMLQTQISQSDKVQKAIEQSDRQIKDTERALSQNLDTEQRAQDLLDAMKKSLDQEKIASDIFSSISNQSADGLTPEEKIQADKDLADWKADFQNRLDAALSNANDSPGVNAQGVLGRTRTWV